MRAFKLILCGASLLALANCDSTDKDSDKEQEAPIETVAPAPAAPVEDPNVIVTPTGRWIIGLPGIPQSDVHTQPKIGQ